MMQEYRNGESEPEFLELYDKGLGIQEGTKLSLEQKKTRTDYDFVLVHGIFVKDSEEGDGYVMTVKPIGQDKELVEMIKEKIIKAGYKMYVGNNMNFLSI